MSGQAVGGDKLPAKIVSIPGTTVRDRDVLMVDINSEVRPSRC